MELYADWLLAAHGNRGEPSMAVVVFAAHDGVKLLLQGLSDRAHGAIADLNLVDGADGGDLGGGAGKESLVGDVEHFAGNHLLNNGKVEIARDLQDRVTGNAGQDRVAQRRGGKPGGGDRGEGTPKEVCDK